MKRGEGAGVRPFFEPHSVAVVGASRDPAKAGHQQVRNLQRGFAGPIYPINPRANAICGLPSFASLAAVPAPVDLAILVVPAQQVPTEVAACVAKRVPAVLISASGFAEQGPEGAALQAYLGDLTKDTGTRLWGPNCNGLVNSSNHLLASFTELGEIHPGAVSIISHTGIFAAAFLNQLMEIEGFGVSKVATLGNACDVDVVDVLEYLAGDDDTQVIALYLEGIREGRRFVDVCSRITRSKPVVAVVAAQTEAGARASLSHTANMAGDARVSRGALAQAGVIPAEEYVDLMDLARGLELWGRPRPAQRVAVLSTSGGAGVLTVDHIVRSGLTMAGFSPSTASRITQAGISLTNTLNPLDLWPAMERRGANSAVRAICDAVFADTEVEAAFLIFGAFSGGGTDLDPGILEEAVRQSDKPVVAWLYGPRAAVEPWRRTLAGLRIPVFRDIRTAVMALWASDFAFRRRAAEPTRPPRPRASALSASAQLIAEARGRNAKTLTEPETRRLLQLWGIHGPRERVVPDEDGAARAAKEIGFPVVVKAVCRGLLHKTEAGAVAVDLRSGQAVRAAVRRIAASLERFGLAAQFEGFLVQEMVRGGREVIVGMTTTAQYGPVLMFGLGGTLVEAVGEAVFQLPPLDHAAAARMVLASKASTVLGAHRGRPAADLPAVEQVLVHLSALAQAGLGLDQVEINPLSVLDEGRGALAVDSLVVLADGSHRSSAEHIWSAESSL